MAHRILKKVVWLNGPLKMHQITNFGYNREEHPIHFYQDHMQWSSSWESCQSIFTIYILAMKRRNCVLFKSSNPFFSGNILFVTGIVTASFHLKRQSEKKKKIVKVVSLKAKTYITKSKVCQFWPPTGNNPLYRLEQCVLCDLTPPEYHCTVVLQWMSNQWVNDQWMSHTRISGAKGLHLYL